MLGEYPSVSLAVARQRARKALSAIAATTWSAAHRRARVAMEVSLQSDFSDGHVDNRNFAVATLNASDEDIAILNDSK